MGSASSIIFRNAGAESMINSCYISDEPPPLDLEDLNTNHTWKPYINVKLNVRELGIGEYFLEKNFNLHSTSKAAEKKSKELQKWKNMIKYGMEKTSLFEDETQTYQQNYLIMSSNEKSLSIYFQKKRSSFMKRLQNGPPQKYRCSAWKVALSVENHFQEDSYARTLTMKIPKDYENDIRKDLHRTFPFEDYFNVEEKKPILESELIRPRTATEREAGINMSKGGSDQKPEVKKKKNIHTIKETREVKNLCDLKANLNLSVLNSMAQLNLSQDSSHPSEKAQKKENVSNESFSGTETSPNKNEFKSNHSHASAKELKAIRRSYNNSFPAVNSSEKKIESPKQTVVIVGQEQLFRLLKAICFNFPKIGYCQGMNFVVGFLLIITGGNEIDSYWIFESLALSPRIHIISLYEKEFPMVYLLVHIFWRKLKEEIPELYEQLKEINIPDHVWITQWFMTIYLYSLPMQIVVRIWDFILCEDILSMIKVALALLKIMKKELMVMDAGEIAKYFKSFKEAEYSSLPNKNGTKIDPVEIIKSAKKISIKRKSVSAYTREFVEEFPLFAENIFIKFYLKFDTAGPAEYHLFSEEIAQNYRLEENKITNIKEYHFEHNTMPKDNKLL